jgi:hypothetical protein
VDELVRSALRLDAAAVAEAASAQSDRAAAVAAVAAVQVTSTGGEMAYSICSFFAKQMAAATAVSAPSAAVPAAADAPPSDAPADSSSAPSSVSSVEDAAAAPLAAPVDLVPVLTLLAPSTRAALVASLLAGDLTEEFTHVFAAQKHFLPLTQQRKQREQ